MGVQGRQIKEMPSFELAGMSFTKKLGFSLTKLGWAVPKHR
jgi:hypothetical protein